MSQESSSKRLVLISNGEPYAHNYDNGNIVCKKLAGGLTTGLDPMMQEDKGLWVAWGRGNADFKVVDEENKVKVPDKNGYTLKRVHLTSKEQNSFYYGFSNEIMWPICHAFVSKANFNREYWYTYQKVNKKYAETTIEELKENDLIWVHDYQLSLVPGYIRKTKHRAKIAMFWHIPWPAWEAFRTIPWRKKIIKHMLAADFIAFHTPLFVKNFLDCAKKIGAKINYKNNTIICNNHQTKVISIPLGIDYKQFAGENNNSTINKKAASLKKKYNAEKLIFGVDRLDYTKGILQRLKAMDLLYEKHPEYIGEVTMVQRISPSRTEVKEYQDMKETINRKIAQINGKYQKDHWVPIKYFYDSVPQKELLPYYRAADIALITPLIDGMNLVAKEYLAVQNNGMLILSEFAGAAKYLQDALLVNPYDTETVVDKIHHALQMPEKERKHRLHKLKEDIQTYDINWWRDKFLQKWEEVYDQ